MIWHSKWIIAGILTLMLGFSLVKILKIKILPVILSGIAVAISIALSMLLVEDPKMVPIIPMITGIAALSIITLKDKDNEENREWTISTWGYAKQIIPLLAIGVVTAGFLLGSTHDGTTIAGVIPNSWISALVGGNSIFSNFFASFVGAFMYFATLTEVPILQGLIASGMGKGPALALLLAGPSLSLPNMLVIRGVMGTKKTIIFVILVITMATISGFIYGFFF
ncbi:hypothetical protein SDC9_168172 [bioreactor metagenome]|uniref:Permease n=1 Tax=bioreactor metagenome TaxID=1076179 RepID=A0A645GA76_9ZZZZ